MMPCSPPITFCSIVGQAIFQTAGSSGPSTIDRSNGRRGGGGGAIGGGCTAPGVGSVTGCSACWVTGRSVRYADDDVHAPRKTDGAPRVACRTPQLTERSRVSIDAHRRSRRKECHGRDAHPTPRPRPPAGVQQFRLAAQAGVATRRATTLAQISRAAAEAAARRRARSSVCAWPHPAAGPWRHPYCPPCACPDSWRA